MQMREQRQVKKQIQVNEQNYVDEAERVIQSLIKNSLIRDKNGNPADIVTTSKIRGLLSMSADIYNEVINQPGDQLSADICARIEYLRVRFLYEAGRDEKINGKTVKPVKNLIEESKILDILKEINGSKKNYILFSRYMEALVAFRKYYVEKDD